jgi:hypothetical protein
MASHGQTSEWSGQQHAVAQSGNRGAFARLSEAPRVLPPRDARD